MVVCSGQISFLFSLDSLLAKKKKKKKTYENSLIHRFYNTVWKDTLKTLIFYEGEQNIRKAGCI